MKNWKREGGDVLKQDQGEATVCVCMSPVLWGDNSFIYVFICLSRILTALLAHLYRDQYTACCHMTTNAPRFIYKLSFWNILATDCTLVFHQSSTRVTEWRRGRFSEDFCALRQLGRGLVMSRRCVMTLNLSDQMVTVASVTLCLWIFLTALYQLWQVWRSQTSLITSQARGEWNNRGEQICFHFICVQ